MPFPEPLWSLEELLNALQYSTPLLKADLEQKIQGLNGVQIDSRLVQKNDLFIALKGPNNDGHDYLQQAFENGAGAAFVHTGTNISFPLPVIEVEDSFNALNALATYRRQQFGGTVLGITGSVGKTGTKELLKAALSPFGHVYATEGNLNNHIGLPLTLARLPRSYDFAVLEMGMNHTGEIRELTKLAHPDIAIITEVTGAHSEFFESILEIAQAKAEIFEGLSPTGCAILPLDSPWFSTLKTSFKDICPEQDILTFGTTKDADLCVQESSKGYHFSLNSKKESSQSYDGTLLFPGFHWGKNASAVLAALSYLGKDLEQGLQALSTVPPLPGRGQCLHLQLDAKRSITLIDESYNASPLSFEAALSFFSSLNVCDHKKIVLLGEMLELGPQSPQAHLSLLPFLKQGNLNRLYSCGEEAKPLHDAAIKELSSCVYASDAKALYAPLLEDLEDKDVILAKGSLGSGVFSLVSDLKKDALSVKIIPYSSLTHS